MKKPYQMTAQEWAAYNEKGCALVEKCRLHLRKLRNKAGIQDDCASLERRIDTAKRRYLSLKEQFTPSQPRQNLYDL